MNTRLLPALVCVALVTCATAHAQSLTVSGTTTLPEDTVASYSSITVQNGGVLEIGGGSNITVTGTLAIQDGGTVLARGKNVTTQVGGAWVGEGVTIQAVNVTIATGGLLSADGQGYRNGAGPGAHAPISGQPGYHTGASHGGRGVTPFAERPAIGAPLAPVLPGSSGGIFSSETTAGGGAIRLIVTGTLTLDGEISADGTATAPAANVYHGGAAGGSIWVTTGTLAGAGRFTADASARSNSIAASAGGRIAVHYASAAGYSGFASATALGTPDTAAEAGTIAFVDTSVAGGHLRVFQRLDFAEDVTLVFGAVTAEPGGLLRVGGGSTLSVAGTLTVAGGGTLLAQGRHTTGLVNGAWAAAGVTLEAANVTIATGGLLSADGQGYRNGTGPGAHAPISGQPYYHTGASHGGRGVTPFADVPAYGSDLAPMTPGSSGGIYVNETTAGGGVIRLIVSGTLALHGEISADGTATAPAANVYHGGAAGGSIWVTTGALTGAGRFTADASARSNSIAACAGGRIAVYYADAAGFSGFAASSANATPDSTAEPGTVGFIDTTVEDLHLRVFQRWRVAPGASATWGRLTLDDAALFELGGGGVLHVLDTLVVRGDSLLRVEGINTTAQVEGAWAGVGGTVRAQHVTVEAGSAITADGQGYRNPSSPELQLGAGPGFDLGALAASQAFEAGSSHGGVGRSRAGYPIGPVYGDALQPRDLGSCSGRWNGNSATAGGGAIHLIVDGTLTLEGEITADGQATPAAVGIYHSGASGGSLWVEAHRVQGAGRFSADAAPSANSDARSAGGRIAVYYREGADFSGFTTSSVHAGGPTAQDGTLLFLDRSVPGHAVRVTQRMAIAEGATAIFGSLTIDDGALFELGGGAVLDVADTLVISGGSTVRVHARDLAMQPDGTWVGTGGTIAAKHLTVAAGSRITADGAGYRNGAGPGYSDAGMNPSLRYQTGSSHGGRGAPATGFSIPAPYGSALEPVAVGSSGGIHVNESTAGGGAIRILVEDTLAFDGEISANGTGTAPGSSVYHGGASGGSLWVATGTLTGAGRFSADAFASSNSQGQSAGGRIAVYSADAGGFSGFATSTAARGGPTAEHGTVAFVDTSAGGLDVRVFGRLATEEGATLLLDSLTLEPGATFDLRGASALVVEDLLDLKAGATLHLQAVGRTTPVSEFGVAARWVGAGGTIDAGTMRIAEDARLDGDGQGYLNGAGPGGVVTVNDYNTGASHGGRGGGTKAPAVYGSLRAPREPGSGGGRWSGETTAGGGAVFLNVAEALVLDGTISVDGLASGPYHAGATGGSIMINAGSVSGAGTLSADAAASSNSTAGSGGGRIAVHTAGENTLGADQYSARGGAPNGTDGTVHVGSSPQIEWLAPQDPIVRGVVPVSWSGLALNRRTATYDLLVSGAGHAAVVATGLREPVSTSWDASMVPDGRYELRVIARGPDGTVIAQGSHEVVVVNDAEWHTGTITASETWSAGRLHLVRGVVTIAAPATVTIESGAVVKFLPGASLVVEAGATLATPATGPVRTILTDFADDTAAGDTNRDGNTSRPIAGRWGGVVGHPGATLLIDDATEIRYVVRTYSGTLPASQTWLGNQVHIVTGDLTVPSGMTLTILPGAIVKFAPTTGISVNSGGELQAPGTLAQPIIFTSDRDDTFGGDTNGDGNSTAPAPGDWHWLYFAGEGHLRHAHVLYAGGSPSGVWRGDAAIRTTGAASVTLENSFIKDAFFDGVLPWGGSMTITNCVITRADRGIMAHPGSTVTVTNTTVDQCREGINCHGGTLTVANSLVTNCLVSGIQYDFGVIESVTHTNVWNTAPTALNYRNHADRTGVDGNISRDPRYRDPARDDYRLGHLSPAIDAADGARAPETDMLGVARYDDPRTANTGINGVADMGAYEFADTAPSQLDLVPAGVDGPAEAVVGARVAVRWTIANAGPVAIVGPWRDRVALQPAADTDVPLVHAGEFVVGTGLRLGPGESAEFSREVTVPPAIDGRYRWVVETNIHADIFEGQNTANNRRRAATATLLTVPELTVGADGIAGAFTAVGAPVLFKVTPAAGTDVLLSLDRAGDGGWTRLALAADRLPTLSDHDVLSPQWSTPDASAALAPASGETVYVSAYPIQMPSTPLGFTLRAQEVAFALERIELARGANRGTATIPIVGAGLRAGATVTLTRGGATLTAASLYLADGTRLHATFDLNGAVTGAYDLHVEQGGVVRTLPGAFTVVAGRAGELRTAVLMAPIVRAGRQFTAWIEYENVGETDLVLPIIGVTSPDGIPLALVAGDAGAPTLSVLATSPVGTPWILAPGQSGRVPVLYTTRDGQNRIVTTTTTVESTAAMDWAALRAELRPAVNVPTGWDGAWDATVAQYGATTGDYARWMRDAFELWHARTGLVSHDPAPALRFALAERIAAAGARVEGRVFLGDTSRPLGGIVVSLLDAAGEVGAAAMTARDGFVRFTGVPAGAWLAAFDDHLPPVGHAAFTLPASGPVLTRTWILQPGGEIRGTVLLDGSLDRDALTVGALHRTARTVHGAEIDALGRYRLGGLLPGDYSVHLTGEGIVPVRVDGVTVVGAGIVAGPELPVVRPEEIHGIVRHADTLEPVSGAVVAAFGPGLPGGGATTDDEGRFVLRGVSRGTYTVSATAAGMTRAAQAGVVVDVGPAPTVELTLAPGATLTGRVQSGGSAVVDAIVLVLEGDTLIGTAATAADGTYSIGGLPAGTFAVAVESAAHQPAETTAVLTAGTTVTLDVALTAAPRLSGVVRDSGSDAGAAGLALRLIAPDGTIEEGFTDADGRILFGRLAEGTYHVSLFDGSHRRAVTVLADGGGVGTFDMSVSAGSIAGRLTTADGAPAVASVLLVADGAVVSSQATTRDGEYLFSVVAPGEYTLKFVGTTTFFPPVPGVVVEEGRRTEIPVVAAGVRQLTVTHPAGAGTAWDALVLLEPLDADLGRLGIRLVETDASGQAVFTGLVAGDYRLQAIDAGGVSAATTVTLAAADVSLALATAPGGEIRGVVRDGFARHVAGAVATAYRAGAPGERWSVRTSERGEYVISLLPAGTYTLVIAADPADAEAPRLAPAIVTGVVVAPDTAVIRDPILLETPVGVSGRLAGADGSVPLFAVVELRDANGLAIARAVPDADGLYALPRVPAGAYQLVARARHFVADALALTLASGESRANVDLTATWAGGLGGRELAGAAGAEAEPGFVSHGLLSLGSDYAQRFQNAMNKLLRDLLGAPPEAVPNLRRPPQFASLKCPCPEAEAAWQKALFLQRMSEDRWNAWNEYWQGRYEEIAANLGLAGVNLLKFAGNFLSAMAEAPKSLVALEEARRELLLQIGRVRFNRIDAVDPVQLLSMEQTLARLNESIDSFSWLLNNAGGLVGGAVGSFAEGGGIYGNATGILEVFANPGEYFTKERWSDTIEQINSFVGNAQGMLGTLTALASTISKLDAITGPLGDALGKLGIVTDGLQTLIESYRLVDAQLGTLKDLEAREWEYHQTVKARDRAYEEALRLIAACAEKECDEDEDDPDKEKDKPKPPAPDGGKPGGSGGSSTITSVDPNDKASTGVGENGYITPGSPIYYHIRFENLPTATAAAQLVTIADQLSPSLDWSTFELVSIGFNGTTLTPPPGLQSYSTRTFVESDPNPIDVSFSLNPDTGLAFWSMRSVDAVSGDWPEDPFAGFLPPNDETGRGEGHVGFLIRPRADLEEGASFTNQARIIFDDNEPIDTNVVTNTIDGTAATAATAALAATSGAQFAVSWSGYDAGSGVARYEVWVSIDGGAFTLWRDGITGTSTVFTGEVGRSYAFYVRAFDRLGQAVGLAPVAQATTTVVPASGSSRLVNISTRGFNGAGNEAMIVGFVVREGAVGSTPKNLLLRGVGPALVPFGVQDALADPSLQLFDRDGLALGSNDNWGQAPNAGVLPAEFDRLGAFGLPAGSADAVVLDAYPPGIYTARVAGAGDSTGVTLVEAYDADTSFDDPALPQILNLSTRGWVGTDDATLIAGFVIQGNAPKALLIRAVGPTLGAAPFNLPGTLADPVIRLADGTGATVYENDDWGTLSDPLLISEVSNRVGAFGLPAGSGDAVMVVVLPPGRYTALVSGKPASGTTEGSTGLVILELYDADL